MRAPTTGRRSIFRGKDRLRSIKAYLTRDGRDAFTTARSELAAMVGWTPDEVSEGDTVQWALLGRPALVCDEEGNYCIPNQMEVRPVKKGSHKGGKKGGKKQVGY